MPPLVQIKRDLFVLPRLQVGVVTNVVSHIERVSRIARCARAFAFMMRMVGGAGGQGSHQRLARADWHVFCSSLDWPREAHGTLPSVPRVPVPHSRSQQASLPGASTAKTRFAQAGEPLSPPRSQRNWIQTCARPRRALGGKSGKRTSEPSRLLTGPASHAPVDQTPRGIGGAIDVPKNARQMGVPWAARPTATALYGAGSAAWLSMRPSTG
jgi:hypothetical protein